MNQNVLVNKKWEEDEEVRSDDCDVLELNIGDSIEGTLIEKFEFDGAFDKKNWGYIIKTKNDERPKLIFGSTILNKKMVDREVGSEIRVERIQDGKTKKGAVYKDFKTYHMKEALVN